MKLTQLHFASAVASTGSFTAAAAACCVTQPTLSNSLVQLEDELGGRLFQRTTRKVALTPFGAHVLPYINEVLSAETSLIQQTQAFLSPGKRLIRIGTSPLVNAHLLALMLEPFRLRHPQVDVVLREMNMQDLYRMLEDGLLDFVFGVANVQKGAWATAFLYEEPLLFIPRNAEPSNKPNRQSVQLKDVAGETFIMVPDACGLSRATRALFRTQRRKLHEYSGEAMSYQVLGEWAALGIGAAILPKSKLAAGGHTALPITDKLGREITIAFEVTWLGKGSQPSHLLEFSNHLRKVVPALVSGLGPAK